MVLGRLDQLEGRLEAVEGLKVNIEVLETDSVSNDIKHDDNIAALKAKVEGIERNGERMDQIEGRLEVVEASSSKANFG